MQDYLRILTILIFAIIAGSIVLRVLFKNSIFLRIGIIWVSNVFLIVINSKIHYSHPEKYPFPIALAAGLILTALMLYSVSLWVRKPMLDLIRIIKKTSTGNFASIEKKQIKEFGELKDLSYNILDLKKFLKGTISKIKCSATTVDNIGNSSGQIAQKLSSSNSQQASSIQQISASMEEMNANIESSHFNSQKTQQFSLDAKNNLERSNHSAMQLLTAMQEMGKKLDIIDEIANETNLLALNASIEAKQAGEAGKGFNVVAGEIRLLAENSKKASDEIKEIIHLCNTLSENVTKDIEHTIPSMNKTVDLMEEITTASSELKSGSNQITDALNGINQITQFNAKLAEEMSVSSEKLTSQSNQLVKNINSFKI